MTQVTRLEISAVASALGDLTDELVFVGGSSLILLVGDQPREELRPTTDIDSIVDVDSYTALYEFEKRLEKRGFKRSDKLNNPICRWKLNDITLDVMPSKRISGHVTNRWYDEAIAHSTELGVDNGSKVKVISPGYFVATKLEAFKDRGNASDLLGSISSGEVENKDLEDIILLFDLLTPTEIFDNRLSQDAKSYIQKELKRLSKIQSLSDFVSRCLSADFNDQRSKRILDLFRHGGLS
jgi:hypothetical protein